MAGRKKPPEERLVERLVLLLTGPQMDALEREREESGKSANEIVRVRAFDGAQLRDEPPTP